MDKVRPDPNFYPNYDENLAAAMRQETELFFSNLVRENRSLLDLYQADYTFVNERLARHYGIPNVAGQHFRRVTYPDDTRQGPGLDIARQPHVAGAARQVGHGGPDGNPATAPAGGRSLPG